MPSAQIPSEAVTARFTISHLDRLLKEGKIRSYTLTKREKKKSQPALPKPSKEKAWIGWNLKIWCEERGLELKTEYRFHPERLWRLDHAILDFPGGPIGIEYEGIVSEKSRHTTLSGYTGDAEKYNAAQAMGYRILRFTAMNYKTLFTELNRLWISTGK